MPSNGDSRQVLLPAHITFVQLVLEGATLSSVWPFDFGTNLIAFHKKQVGIWPIAVSCTLCCRTGWWKSGHEGDGDLLASRQLRFSVRGEGRLLSMLLGSTCLTLARLFWSYTSGMPLTLSAGTRCWCCSEACTCPLSGITNIHFCEDDPA